MTQLLFETCPSCGEALEPDIAVCAYCGELLGTSPAETLQAEPEAAAGYVFEEIGAWSQIKHEIVDKYAAAYMTIMAKQAFAQRVIYIDGFAGTGYAIDRDSGELVMGSAARAMLVQPPFTELHLIERDTARAAQLQRHVTDMADERVTVHPGECVHILRTKVLRRCRYEDRARALCLLDPYGLSVPWTLLEEIGKMRSVEIFFNFMVVAANRNVLWRDLAKVPESRRQKLDLAWGDRSWVDACYRKEQTLFDEVTVKSSNETVAEAFRERLRTKAGFKFVPAPIPVRNDRGGTLYYLYFASNNSTGSDIVTDIFNKYRR